MVKAKAHAPALVVFFVAPDQTSELPPQAVLPSGPVSHRNE
jgi:hypothetical protein